MKFRNIFISIICISIFVLTNTVRADEVAASETTDATTDKVAQPKAETTPEEAATPAPGKASKSLGLNIDLGYASAYIFRGLNVFQEDGQMNQNMMFAPGASWAVFDTGLTIGYWGAFQFTGNNISGNIDGALGAEQDLYVAYEKSLPHDLGLSAGLTYYFYPGSDEAAAGATFASYVEPKIGLNYTYVLDISLNVSYFLGVQDQPGIRGISYLYVNPTISKSFTFSPMIDLNLGLSYGFKLFKEGNDGAANVHDIAFGVGLPIHFAEKYYVSPSVNVAWTNIPVLDIADEIAFWGGINLGVDL